MSFQASIDAFKKKALEQANRKTCDIFQELATSIVLLSPSPSNPGRFAKGLLANQWYPQLGGFSSAISSATSEYGAGSLSRIKSFIATKPFLGKDAVVTFTNNVDHAYRAEVLGWPQGEGANGWIWGGRVGPYGMVMRSVLKVKGMYS